MRIEALITAEHAMTHRSKLHIEDLQAPVDDRNERIRIFNRLVPFIGQRVLEVGAGLGNLTELLLDRELIVAADRDPNCVDFLKTRLQDYRQAHARLFDLENPEPGRLEGFSFDTALCANVLERVEDDRSALATMHALLAPGGRLVLAVPAFQHHRQYTKKTLLRKMREAEFRIETAFYMDLAGMAGRFWNRRIGGLFDAYAAPLVDRVERVIPPPFGLSLIAVGRRARYHLPFKARA